MFGELMGVEAGIGCAPITFENLNGHYSSYSNGPGLKKTKKMKLNIFCPYHSLLKQRYCAAHDSDLW